MAKIKNIMVNGRNLYATPTGFKLTYRGTVIPASALYGTLDKGQARRVRKAVRSLGRIDLASAPRMTTL